MVINEKGLVRAMKAAYKSYGYKVAVENRGATCSIMLAAPGWAVVVLKEHMPRKALGMIVEHLGKIPEAGEAFQVQKHQTQTTIFDVATELVRSVQSEEVRWRIYKTDMTIGGYNLWQRHADRKIVKVSPDLEDIMDSYGREVTMVGDDTLLVEGTTSCVYIQCVTDLWADEDAKLDYLSQMLWVAI